MIDKSLRSRYQWGGPGGKSPSAPGRSGPPGGGDRQMTYSAPAPAPAPSPHRDPVVTKPVTTAKAPPSILAKEVKPSHLGDTGGSLGPRDWEFEGKKAQAPEVIPKKITTTVHGKDDQVFNITSDKKYTPYDPRTSPNALLDRGSGIGGLLKGLGTAAASIFLPMLLPAKAAAAYKMYNTAKTASAFAQKFGVTKDDKLLSLQSKFLNKDMRKQIQKDDIPKVADRHPGTGKKKRTTTDDRGDGVNQIQEIKNLESEVSKGAQGFLSDEQKEQYKLAQNKMKAALAEGYYIDKDGKHIDLSDEQINALTQFITKIDGMLVDPVMMAHGGRVDKALGGRIRDI